MEEEGEMECLKIELERRKYIKERNGKAGVPRRRKNHHYVLKLNAFL